MPGSPDLPVAIAGSPDRPLVVNGIAIQCYVLDDDTRVLTQGSIFRALGRSRTSGLVKGVARYCPFVRARNLEHYVDNEFSGLSHDAIPFRPSSGHNVVMTGYNAEILPAICNVYLSARRHSSLHSSQAHIAMRAEEIVSGLAAVGIVALVDEATGYDSVRVQTERALAKILERYLLPDLGPWTRTFPSTFYEQIYRLNRWDYTEEETNRRPRVIGLWTNQIVYERLPPGLLAEIQARTPRLPSGRLKYHLHRWFNPEYGHPDLLRHISNVETLMRAASRWDEFMRDVDRVFPKINATIPLAIEEDDNLDE